MDCLVWHWVRCLKNKSSLWVHTTKEVYSKPRAVCGAEWMQMIPAFTAWQTFGEFWKHPRGGSRNRWTSRICHYLQWWSWENQSSSCTESGEEWEGDLVTRSRKEAKEGSEFFGSVLKSQVWGRGKVLSRKGFPLVEVDQVREYLGKLCIHTSTGPDGMGQWELRKPADVLVMPLSKISESQTIWSWKEHLEVIKFLLKMSWQFREIPAWLVLLLFSVKMSNSDGFLQSLTLLYFLENVYFPQSCFIDCGFSLLGNFGQCVFLFS